MQTTPKQQKAGHWATTAVLVLGSGLAIILFGVVISRMGLLNRWEQSETSVVAPTTIQLLAQDMRFGQQEIRLKASRSTTFVLDNRDFFDHSFDVDALGLHIAMPPNEEVSFSFAPNQPGTYTISCNVPGHREAGMVATLIIEE